MESSIKSLRLNAKNIKSTLISGNKALKKIRADEKSFLAKQNQEQKKINRENFIEGKKKVSGKMGALGKRLAAPALGFIDKLKEFFGTILLGLAITNIPILIKKVQTWLEENEDLINTVKAVISGLGSALQVIVNIFTTGQPGTSLEDLKKQNKELLGLEKEFKAGGKFEQEISGLDSSVSELDSDFRREFKEDYVERTPEQVREDVVSAAVSANLLSQKPINYVQLGSDYADAVKSKSPTKSPIVIPGVGTYQKVKVPKTFAGFQYGESIEEFATDSSGTEISADEFNKRYTAIAGSNYTTLVEQLKDAGVEGYSEGGATIPSRQGATGEEKIARRDTSTFLDLKTSAITNSEILNTKRDVNDRFSKTLEHLQSYLNATKKEIKKPPISSPYYVPPGAAGPTINRPGTATAPPSSGVIYDDKQPGADFTPAGHNNLVVFPGKVVEIGHQYDPNVKGGDQRQGSGYGNYVVIRSKDPNNPGKEFDGLYAHFPDGEIKVSVGQEVTRGQNLGRMATKEEYENPKTRPRVGSGTGPHTSLDFLVPGQNSAYPHYMDLIPLIDHKNLTNNNPHGPGYGKDGGGPGEYVVPIRNHEKNIKRSNDLTQFFDGEGMTDVVIINSTQPIIVPGPTRYIRR